jgi:hypothetical protein
MILHSNEQKKRSESRKRYLTVYAVLELSKDLLRTRGTTSISTSILQWTSTNASKRSLVITLVGFKAPCTPLFQEDQPLEIGFCTCNNRCKTSHFHYRNLKHDGIATMVLAILQLICFHVNLP